jgi:hypothetical protein
VHPATESNVTFASQKARTEPRLSASELGDWRRSLIRLLNSIDGAQSTGRPEGVANRIERLKRDGRIPRDVAAFMKTVIEVRNQTEYDNKVLTPVETAAVSAAWEAVQAWANSLRR